MVPVTQFGRMCAALGIQIIAASSPQAKGRVERNHGTHQDRLVKKLRRLGLADDIAANAFLATTYWPAHNAQFAQGARESADFHRAVPTARVLDQVFRLEEMRVVGLDWVVRYHNRALQLARQSGQAPARSTVTVCEWEDGRLAITYRGQPIRWTEGRAAIPQPPPVAPPAPRATVIRTKPAATHPWRQGYENLRKDATLWQAIKS